MGDFNIAPLDSDVFDVSTLKHTFLRLRERHSRHLNKSVTQIYIEVSFQLGTHTGTIRTCAFQEMKECELILC